MSETEIVEYLEQKLSASSDIKKVVESIWALLTQDTRCRSALNTLIQNTTDTLHLSTPPGSQPCSPQPLQRRGTKNNPNQVTSQQATSDKPVTREVRLRKRRNNVEVDLAQPSKKSRPLTRSSTSDNTSNATCQPRRFRGPSKAKKAPAPIFDMQGFSSLDESIRRQVYNFTPRDALHECKIFIDAFHTETIVTVDISTVHSRLKQLHACMEHCNALEAVGNGMRIRAVVEWRFYLVQLIVEYRKAKAEREVGIRSDDVNDTFRRELYPKKNASQAKSAWEYDYRIGEILFDAVQRYGYGALIFPLHRLTKKSLHRLGPKNANLLFEYIDKCYPSLQKALSGLSFVLPRLIAHGPPCGGLQMETTELESHGRLDDTAFSRLLPLYAGVSYSDLGATNLSEIPPWPSPYIVDHATNQLVDASLDQSTHPIFNSSSIEVFQDSEGIPFAIAPGQDGPCRIGLDFA